MRPHRFVGLIATLLLGQAALPADAAIVLSGHTSADASFVDGKFVFTLTVASNAPGGLIGGFDGALAGGPPSLAFQTLQGSSFNQVLLAGILPTPTAQNNAAIDEATDTQFKFVDADIISAVPPFETATTLGGGFTFGVAARAQSKAIVQLAFLPGTEFNYAFTISEALPGDVVNLQTFTGSSILTPPPPSEPSSSLLIAIGTIALGAGSLRRRVRRRRD